MSEVAAPYSVSDDGAVRCPQCEITVGLYVTEGTETWIQTGMIRAYAIHGKCASCGSEYHFSASEKKLERLLKRRHTVV